MVGISQIDVNPNHAAQSRRGLGADVSQFRGVMCEGDGGILPSMFERDVNQVTVKVEIILQRVETTTLGPVELRPSTL